jgi:hypothetical protein
MPTATALLTTMWGQQTGAGCVADNADRSRANDPRCVAAAGLRGVRAVRPRRHALRRPPHGALPRGAPPDPSLSICLAASRIKGRRGRRPDGALPRGQRGVRGRCFLRLRAALRSYLHGELYEELCERACNGVTFRRQVNAGPQSLQAEAAMQVPGTVAMYAAPQCLSAWHLLGHATRYTRHTLVTWCPPPHSRARRSLYTPP